MMFFCEVGFVFETDRISAFEYLAKNRWKPSLKVRKKYFAAASLSF